MPSTPFVDVNPDEYYYDPVEWATEEEITTGVDDTHFVPDGICTRAQAVTFIWRAAGSPQPQTDTTPFQDIHPDDYFYEAVLWATEKGITIGTSETTFSPERDCSRAHIVTMLWRDQGKPMAETVIPFEDVDQEAYYAHAVQWAVKNDITTGTAETTFSPDDACTRAHIVTFLYRALALQ